MDSITDSVDMNLSKSWETVKDREAWGGYSLWSHKELDATWQLNNYDLGAVLGLTSMKDKTGKFPAHIGLPCEGHS